MRHVLMPPYTDERSPETKTGNKANGTDEHRLAVAFFKRTRLQHPKLPLLKSCVSTTTCRCRSIAVKELTCLLKLQPWNVCLPLDLSWT